MNTMLDELPALSPDSLPVTEWRLISSGPSTGPFNMALDEVLLDSVIAGGQPTVRFYTWEPVALSLGVNQAVGEVDPEECRRRGFDLVRRMTGGRAVLHLHEFTYSVVAHESDPRVSGGVVESYRKISQALLHGLKALGVDAALAPPNPALRASQIQARRLEDVASGGGVVESHGAVCFDAASDYELTAHGRKLVGSAQARRNGAVLQHGSILLDIDWDAWVSVFAYRTPEGRERARLKLPARMTSLRAELGREAGLPELERALAAGFETVLNLALLPLEPTQAEWAAAERLAAEKYATAAWTSRK